MVSKVAVMAIVGILAVPILLGYALNLEQTTETDYQTTGDSVNVTPLLQQGTTYTYAFAAASEINGNNFNISGVNGAYPQYVSKSFVKSAIYTKDYLYPQAISGNSYTLSNYYYLDTYANYPNYTTQYLSMNVYYVDGGGSHLHTTVNNPLYYSYNDETKTLTYSYYQYGTIYTGSYTNNNIVISFTAYNGYSVNDNMKSQGYSKSDDRVTWPGYVDISAGFRLPAQAITSPYAGETHARQTVSFNPGTTSYIITMDLSSITDANYKFGVTSELMLEKTTTAGVVTWAIKTKSNIVTDPVYQEIYYDQNTNNNTYQLKVWIEEFNSTPGSTPGYYNYPTHSEFRYVGAWPTLIGEANYYQSYDIEGSRIGTTPQVTSAVFGGYADTSPIMRIDQVRYRSMEIQVMKDQIYNPADFKTNPSTTINNPLIYGSSIEFGGNTYTVKNGNITMGTHDIPVKGLVLSSVPNPEWGYDNKIGNTIVSHTPQPSTIKFNGTWSASISTIAQEEYEVTKTEWQAGSFAWDGMDQNFLMVGLLASLGAFIALGIYARRSRASIWPLLIVCGGAALLFFIML